MDAVDKLMEDFNVELDVEVEADEPPPPPRRTGADSVYKMKREVSYRLRFVPSSNKPC